MTYESVGPEVVGFDVVKVRGVPERGVLPIQLLHPPETLGQSRHDTLGYETSQPVDIRISMADIADVAFEVSDIDWIETDLDR